MNRKDPSAKHSHPEILWHTAECGESEAVQSPSFKQRIRTFEISSPIMQDQSRLLLSISHVVASQIYEGEQSVLAEGTLSVTLLSHPFDPATLSETDPPSSSQQLSQGPNPSSSQVYATTSHSSAAHQDRSGDNDLFLYLSIGQNDFDLPLPANTTIIPQGRSAYLIPSRDIPHALLRLDLGSSSTDDLETFEVLLSQFTAYEERPSDITRKDLVLVDSEDGHVVGSVPQTHLIVNEDPSLSQPGHEKDPVFVDITSDPTSQQNTVTVTPATMNEYRAQSSLVRAADVVSSGILYSSNTFSKGINSSANWYINKRPTSELPVTFQPATLERVRKIHQLSNSAVVISAKATGFLAQAAHSMGAGVRQKIAGDEKAGKKPSLLNKSLIAFETIADSIDTSTRQLLSTSSSAATMVVRHRYGEQAADISHGLGSTVRNVGLVYVDARGVTRKALIKGAAKGMLFKAKVGNGNEVVLGGGGLGDSDSSEIQHNTKNASDSLPQESGLTKDDGAGYSQLDHPGTWGSDKGRGK